MLTATVTTDDGTSEFSPCTRTHAAPTPAAGTAPVATGPARQADDATPPRITRLKLTPSTFAVGSKPTPIGLSGVRRGSSIRFTLSEAAQVELRFDRLVVGRRVTGSCKRTTRANRSRNRCLRGLRAGTLNRAGVAGPNRIVFSGRIGRRGLKRGPYRLTAQAVDAAANAATPRTIRFNVVKRRARN